MEIFCALLGRPGYAAVQGTPQCKVGRRLGWAAILGGRFTEPIAKRLSRQQVPGNPAPVRNTKGSNSKGRHTRGSNKKSSTRAASQKTGLSAKMQTGQNADRLTDKADRQGGDMRLKDKAESRVKSQLTSQAETGGTNPASNHAFLEPAPGLEKHCGIV